MTKQLRPHPSINRDLVKQYMYAFKLSHHLHVIVKMYTMYYYFFRLIRKKNPTHNSF